MGFCKRKAVECECITDHSVCNSDNCHRKLPDAHEEALLTYQLLEIATELDTREATNNCVIRDLQGVSYKELCDHGIEILQKLKGGDKMRVKINLDTLRDVNDFVRICSCIGAGVYITDGNGLCVSAKSMIGVMYSLEFDEIWCECDEDIYHKIDRFVI